MSSGSLDVDDTATEYFRKWTSRNLTSALRDHKQMLTGICRNFINICNEGIKENQRSVYLTNKAMRQALSGYDEWGQYILTGNVGIHKKFKANAAILAHIVKCIDSYREKEQKMAELNDKIYNETDNYNTLDDMLDAGMLQQSLIKKNCVAIFCLNFFNRYL